MGILKKLKKSKSRRGVSPVIATVILVAIAITVSVAVAYWMGGIAGQHTKFEQIEIQNVVCKKVVSGADHYWNVTVYLKNTGTRGVTMLNAFVNDREVDGYGATTFTIADDNWQTSMVQEQYLDSGESAVVLVYIDPDKAGTSLTSGTSVNINLHSAGGMDYPKLITLT